MKDLSNTRIGKWLVISYAGRNVKNAHTWLCKCDCGTEKIQTASNILGGNTRSCGCGRSEFSPRGKRHKNWRGGKSHNADGYVLVHAPKDHPRPQSHGWIMEHRLVMEKHLGRYLTRSETVHHINGKKDDNRIENLELFLRSHSDGIRLSDAIVMCEKIWPAADLEFCGV